MVGSAYGCLWYFAWEHLQPSMSNTSCAAWFCSILYLFTNLFYCVAAHVRLFTALYACVYTIYCTLIKTCIIIHRIFSSFLIRWILAKSVCVWTPGDGDGKANACEAVSAHTFQGHFVAVVDYQSKPGLFGTRLGGLRTARFFEVRSEGLSLLLVRDGGNWVCPFFCAVSG